MTEKPARPRLFHALRQNGDYYTHDRIGPSPARHQGINHRRLHLLILIQPLIDNYYPEGGHVEWFACPRHVRAFRNGSSYGVPYLWLDA